ncbi:MAG: DUF1902 domain-containing protein [Cyanobacteria bacterium J06639_1]
MSANPSRFHVSAVWDAEAEVWTATSENIPGLVTEADTLDALTAKLQVVVPDLLVLNDVLDEHSARAIELDILSQRRERVQVTA